MNRDPGIARDLVMALLLGAAPATSYAHGQQVLLVPFGQLVALIPAAVIAWRLTRTAAARTVVVLAALLVPVVFWFMPNEYLPVWLFASEISSFLAGFTASTFVALALALSWRALFNKASRRNP